MCAGGDLARNPGFDALGGGVCARRLFFFGFQDWRRSRASGGEGGENGGDGGDGEEAAEMEMEMRVRA